MSSVPRFFVPPDAVQGDTVTLPPESAHHARNVLRLRPGEALIVHDGAGTAYHCRLLDGSGGKQATARVESSGPVATEPKTRITVAQALPKTSDKIEQILQHGTEVGAAGFVVWPAARSVARLADGDKVDKRLARWRGIVQGAAEQSGRGVLPTVGWLGSAPDLARTFGDYDAVFVLHEGATTPLHTALDDLPTATRLLFIVGPEGGLTADHEVPQFVTGGARAVTLGTRVLRTETAALVALAQALYHRGE
jgi:16S rRNA (uracil1498-N3)-methyltransferase